MTDEELDELADKLAERLINIIFPKPQEYTIQFETEKEILEQEIIRLNKLLIKYERVEAYEKAAILKRKIEYIKNKIKRIDEK
jgi:hypothetical protein